MTSPLEEAKADSLSELFSRDPMLLTTTDIDHIIEALREMRKEQMQADAQAQSRGKRTKGKAALPKSPSQMSLEELLS